MAKWSALSSPISVLVNGCDIKEERPTEHYRHNIRLMCSALDLIWQSAS